MLALAPPATPAQPWCQMRPEASSWFTLAKWVTHTRLVLSGKSSFQYWP